MTFLDRSDYEEPACLLNMNRGLPDTPRERLPLSRILDRLDRLLGARDWTAAERHLEYWLAEAKAQRDRQAELSLYNELMGFYRKQDRRDRALAAMEQALTLLRELKLEDSILGGTTLVNAATVRKAFGDAEGALPLFEEARSIYKKYLPAKDCRLGGLFNNYALALTDTGRYDEARALYLEALSVMEQAGQSAAEQAITCLNLADLWETQGRSEEISPLLDRAEALLRDPELPHDAYYAFVAEKCAPGFDYYGYFAFASELKAEAERIYAAL